MWLVSGQTSSISIIMRKVIILEEIGVHGKEEK